MHPSSAIAKPVLQPPHPNSSRPLKSLATAFVLGAALFASSASAFQPLITDDTGTQGAGGNQLEVSLNQSRTTTNGVSDRIGSLPVVYTRGISESVDLFAGASYLRLQPGTGDGKASGAGNSAVDVKWRILDTTSEGTSAAAKVEILLPISGSAELAGLGSASIGANLTFILSQDLPFGAIHVNAGVGHLRYRASGDNPDSTPLRLSVAPVWQLDAHWRLALDMGAQWVKSSEQNLRTGFVELGAIWSPDEDVDLALGVIRSADNLTPRPSTLAATAGLTWRFK